MCVGDGGNLTRPAAACPLCKEERCAEDGVRWMGENEVGGRRQCVWARDFEYMIVSVQCEVWTGELKIGGFEVWEGSLKGFKLTKFDRFEV